MTVLHLPMLTILAALLLAAPPSAAQQAADSDPRAATGGAQTLEDIMARQRGERVDDRFRREAVGDPARAAGIRMQLGTLGGASDAEVFRALRYGGADVTVSAKGHASEIIIQDGGMRW
ncbi:MAG: formate dehydrogenase subunit gamma, partial [Alphaproteobacteria bacterium]|nr:formate dehydrogenase subunit gamma [Alphaproteobacteria bacterium]